MIEELKTIKNELPEPAFPESALLEFIEKIYSKAPTMPGVPNLKEVYSKAIQEQDIIVLKDLLRALFARLNYDMKYTGCEEDAQYYKQKKGYSWDDLNSVSERLQAWIESKK